MSLVVNNDDYHVTEVNIDDQYEDDKGVADEIITKIWDVDNDSIVGDYDENDDDNAHLVQLDHQHHHPHRQNIDPHEQYQ